LTVASSVLTVVVGGGISGLSCAYSLRKSGGRVLLLEAGPRAGGVIQSVTQAGYLFELGPQSFRWVPALDQLTRELGLTGQLLEAPAASPRFVLVDERLVALPRSPLDFLGSRLLGWKTKLAILAEVFATTRPPESDESIAAFTRRKFSAELLDRLVGPFVSGIYAGDPEQISLRAAFPEIHSAEESAGSVVRGMVRRPGSAQAPAAARGSRRRAGLVSFRNGNQTLVSAMALAIQESLVTNARVVSLAKGERGFVVKAQTSAGTEEIPCERVVLAIPAGAAASLLAELAPVAAAALREIGYAPVAVVSLAYRSEQTRHPLKGFGFLIPRSAGLRTLGTVWNSSQFPDRAPEGHALLTSFVGGATDPDAIHLADQELAATVHQELSRILGITGAPVHERVTSYQGAIPQYHLGHSERLGRMREALERVPGLWIAGNYFEGPSVGSSIEQALSVAERVRISYNS